MTSDKQNPGHLAKPFTPSLSTAFHRSNPKSPLTPKLASPGGYRTPRRLAQSEHPTNTPSKDDHHPSTPASYLSANVTPRSSSRSTRRDTAITTPTSTPSGTPSAPSTPYSCIAPGSQNGGGYRSERSPVRAGAKLEPLRPSRARTLTAESQHSSRPLSSDAPSSPMFFHASDARSPNSNSSDPDPRLKPPSKSTTSATFFYANGRGERRSGEEATPPVPPIKRRSTGLSRPASQKPSPTTASPRLRSSRPSDSSPRPSDSVQPQPAPQDDSTENNLQRQSLPLPNTFDRPPPTPLRRHVKSSSVDSGSNHSPREALKPSPLLVSPSDLQPDSNAAPSEPSPGLRPRIFSNGSGGSGETPTSASPSKSDATAAQSDPAASARIERKIMDLEISNSSLLAINRTLEREMRKQNGDLRRFRRLSRAGRFAVEPSSRSVSATAPSTTTETEEGASEASSAPARSPVESSESSDEDEDEDSADEGVMSPGSLAEHDAKHRARDEKRVFVDLAKHQELLTDSQKLDQSLRRCLGWTEELIKEGKKALEYNVHINDIELGGRVLAPEELQDIGDSARGLLSSTADYKNELSSETEPDDSNKEITDTSDVSDSTDTA